MKNESWLVDLETEPLEVWPSDEQLDRFADSLIGSTELAGAVPGANLATHTLSLRTAVDDKTGDAAVNRAIKLFFLATHRAGLRPARITEIEVSLDPGDDIDPRELVSGGEVARRLGLTRERIRQLAAEPKRFPRPVAVIGRDRVWRWRDVANWAVAKDRKTKLPRRRPTVIVSLARRSPRAVAASAVARRGSTRRVAASGLSKRTRSKR